MIHLEKRSQMGLEGRVVKGEGPDAGWADVKRL